MKEDEINAGNKCHWGNKFAFQAQKLRFSGAGSFRGLATEEVDVFIDCGANIRNDKKQGSDPAQKNYIIKINWMDGEATDMTERDWLNLLDSLEKTRLHLGKDILDILVCCVGGHGRTGTALSILAALTGAEAENPVRFIREAYCRKAVETTSQCSYIKKIAHLSTEEDLPQSESEASCESSLI